MGGSRFERRGWWGGEGVGDVGEDFGGGVAGLRVGWVEDDVGRRG